MPPIIVEPTRQKSHGPCPHCGGLEQTVWGWVHRGEPTRAVYYVRWTAGRPQHGMMWHLAIGDWGEGSVDSERRSIGLRSRMIDGRPGFMIVDAATTPWGRQPSGTLGTLLTREQALGTETAKEAFSYVHEILIRDPRVERFVRTGEGVPDETPGLVGEVRTAFGRSSLRGEATVVRHLPPRGMSGELVEVRIGRMIVAFDHDRGVVLVTSCAPALMPRLRFPLHFLLEELAFEDWKDAKSVDETVAAIARAMPALERRFRFPALLLTWLRARRKWRAATEELLRHGKQGRAAR